MFQLELQPRPIATDVVLNSRGCGLCGDGNSRGSSSAIAPSSYGVRCSPWSHFSQPIAYIKDVMSHDGHESLRDKIIVTVSFRYAFANAQRR